MIRRGQTPCRGIKRPLLNVPGATAAGSCVARRHELIGVAAKRQRGSSKIIHFAPATRTYSLQRGQNRPAFHTGVQQLATASSWAWSFGRFTRSCDRSAVPSNGGVRCGHAATTALHQKGAARALPSTRQPTEGQPGKDLGQRIWLRPGRGVHAQGSAQLTSTSARALQTAGEIHHPAKTRPCQQPHLSRVWQTSPHKITNRFFDDRRRRLKIEAKCTESTYRCTDCTNKPLAPATR